MASKIDIVALLKVKGYPFEDMINFLEQHIFKGRDPILTTLQMDALARYYIKHDSVLIYPHLIGVRYQDHDGGMFEFDMSSLGVYGHTMDFGPNIQTLFKRKKISKKLDF